jgi:hypothetical protein
MGRNTMSSKRFRIDWAFVRGFGELTILTRASYTLLLLIPVLALAWPVLGTISQQMESVLTNVATSSEEVLRVIQRAELSLSILEQTSEADVIKNTTNPIAEVLDDLEKATQEAKASASAVQKKIQSIDPRLPKALAQSFLAAAAIFIGQLLYQAFANRITKESSIDEYESSKKADYKNYPNTAILEDAFITMIPKEKKDTVSAANGSLKGKAESVRKSMIQAWDLRTVISTYTEMDEKEKSQLVQFFFEEESKALALVGLASREQYRSAARTWLLCSYISLSFYLIGLYFIFVAFIKQVLDVVGSAKISSILDIFCV